MKPWQHFQRPSDTELEAAAQKHRDALATANEVIDTYSSVDPEHPPVGHDDAVEEEVVMCEGNPDPDFYPPHLPPQYHELGLVARFLALFTFWGSNGNG